MSSIWTEGITQSLVTTLVILLIIYLYKRWHFFNLFRRYGIPGPSPNILFGNFGDLKLTNKKFAELEADWIRKYGKVVGFFGGSRPILLIADLELLKQICIKEFSKFPNRPIPILDNRPVFGETLITLTDEKWKTVRSLVGPTFSSRKMKQMSNLMSECVNLLIEITEEKAKSGEEFDIYQRFQGLTLDVIGRCALAMEVDCQRNPKDTLLNAVRTFFVETTAFSYISALMGIFPMFKIVLSPLQRMTPVIQMENLIIKNVKEVIRRRREHPEKHETVDVLQLLLNANEKDAKEYEEETDEERKTSTEKQNISLLSRKLTDNQVIANAYLFVLAGYETTSTALAFISYLLAKHPHIQEKLYEEIVDQIGLDEKPTYDSVQKIPYLEQVILESLRLYTPVPNFVIRESKEEIKLEGVTIPPKCGIMAAAWNIHHDPEIWPNPEVFDPTRFSPENKANHHPMQYLVFGSGPRNCIGARFARLEMKVALVSLLRKFRFIPGPSFKDPLPVRQAGVLYAPSKGIWLKVEPRSTDL